MSLKVLKEFDRVQQQIDNSFIVFFRVFKIKCAKTAEKYKSKLLN